MRSLVLDGIFGNGDFLMKRVLFVGQEPETVDFSDPSLPAGFDADKIRHGIEAGMKQMKEMGWDARLCLVRPDDSAAVDLTRELEATTYDCVVIGGGLRIPPKGLLIFESLV